MTDDTAFEVLSLLDDIASRPGTMGFEDIENLCEARDILAAELHAEYNEETNRYTAESE